MGDNKKLGPSLQELQDMFSGKSREEIWDFAVGLKNEGRILTDKELYWLEGLFGPSIMTDIALAQRGRPPAVDFEIG